MATAWGLPTFPGHYCPGLIEAALPGQRETPFRSFPGHYCPGLIEAGFLPVLLLACRPPFRGITAPASLKPPGSRLPSCSAGAFPGHYCPGLIEARWPVTLLRSMAPFPGHYCPGLIEADRYRAFTLSKSRPFRGITAPASLKPSDDIVFASHRVPFRGITAPASLKPDIGEESGAWEAFLSGALLPRPH